MEGCTSVTGRVAGTFIAVIPVWVLRGWSEQLGEEVVISGGHSDLSKNMTCWTDLTLLRKLLDWRGQGSWELSKCELHLGV